MRRMPPPPKDFDVEEFKQLIQTEKTFKDIAKRLNTSPGILSYWRKREGLFDLKPTPYGQLHEKIKEFHEAGLTDGRIGKQLSKTSGYIRHHRMSLGLPMIRYATHRYSAEQFVELYNQGLSIYAIAKKVGCARATVSKYLRKAGIVIKHGGRSQLSVSEIDKMAAMSKEGKTTREIAEELGRTYATVVRYLKRMGLFVPGRRRYKLSTEAREKMRSKIVEEYLSWSTDSKFLERAEYLDAERLNEIDLLDIRNTFSVKDYLTNDLAHIRFYVGAKGLGKTLAVMKAVSEYIQETPEAVVSFILFKALDRPYLLDPLKLASRETWGDRMKIFDAKETDLSYYIEESDVIVLDDLHYMVEAIIQGQLDREVFILILKTMIDQVKKGKKVILISEAPLRIYAEALKWKELDELLPYLGMRPNDRHNKTPIHYTSFREFLPLNEEGFYNLAEVYDIRITGSAMSLLHSLTSRPRGFLKFCNLFTELDEITLIDVLVFAQKIVDRLVEEVTAQGVFISRSMLGKYKRLLEKGVYPFKTPPEIATQLLKRDLSEQVHNYDSYTSRVCDNIAVTLWVKYSPSYKKDRRNFPPSWYFEPHCRLVWAERKSINLTPMVAQEVVRLISSLEPQLIEKGDAFKLRSRRIEGLIREYYRSPLLRKWLKTFKEERYHLVRFNTDTVIKDFRRISTLEYLPLDAFEYAFSPLLRETSTEDYVSIFSE